MIVDQYGKPIRDVGLSASMMFSREVVRQFYKQPLLTGLNKVAELRESCGQSAFDPSKCGDTVTIRRPNK
jgi:hypothetical protein